MSSLAGGAQHPGPRELYDLDALARALGKHANHLTSPLARRLKQDRETNRA